ncbi:MAG: phosphatidate cytidylyltransferase [Pseudomonadota bacterium]
MHTTRIISALIPLPVLIGFIVVGGPWFTAFVALAGLIAMWEYLRMVGGDGAAASERGLAALALLSVPVMLLSALLGSAPALMAASALFLVGFGAVTIACYPSKATVFNAVPHYFLGVCYISVPLGLIVLIRGMADGIAWIFFILCIVFANDVAAYFAGTRWGRRKLWPAVSPGKTLEGSAGGLTACFLVGCVFWALFLNRFPLAGCLLCIIGIGIAGPLGDLFESVIKRTHGVKDSGSIMPGHGGLLDRIDALLFAVPVAYAFRVFLQ